MLSAELWPKSWCLRAVCRISRRYQRESKRAQTCLNAPDSAPSPVVPSVPKPVISNSAAFPPIEGVLYPLPAYSLPLFDPDGSRLSC